MYAEFSKINTALAAIALPPLPWTLDDSPIGETSATERRFLHDRMVAPESCLPVLDGGTLNVTPTRMSGRRATRRSRSPPAS